MRPLQLKLLGQFECSRGKDERISLPMRKAEVLLAYLALAPGLRHPRERLINLLWSERSDEQARNSLRQCLSSIRKALGDAADLTLSIDRTTVSLKPELIEVDAHEFERLALQGDFESLDTAASLYQGEFLEGISIRDPACQEWLGSERGRFKRQLIEILTNLAETQLVTHDFAHAIKSAERLVEQDPLAESGWRLLMRGYFENGNRNHALKAYQRCEQVLRQELGVEPEAATRQLRERIAGGGVDPGLGPARRAVAIPKRESSDRSIVVLPFDNLSGDPKQEYFSDGITDSIILNLALFPGLQIKSRNASFAFKQQIKTIGEISAELGVDYLVEGSLRKSEDRIRITAQLIESASGSQIWGKRYDAKIDDLFDLEEELSRTIAATVTGQIDSDLQRIALTKGASDLQAYDLLLAGIYHTHKFTGPDSVIAIDLLNRCLELDPDNVRAHAMLYYNHAMNWMERWIEDFQPSFELSGIHARKAIELDPDSPTAIEAYAEYLIICRQFEQADRFLEKALTLNPNNTNALTTKAINQEMQGDFEAALQTAQLADRLDPYHPWADWALAEAHFLCGDYEATLEVIERSKNAPAFIRIYSVAANIELGRISRARTNLKSYLKECRREMRAMPRTVDEWMQYTIDNAPFEDTSINQRLIDLLVRAGLDQELAEFSTADGGDSMPAVLVLPFENLSGDPEQEYFSHGMTESLIQNLGALAGLQVKSRHTSFAFKDSSLSLEALARQLDVQYIIDGSVRKRGDQLRIAAQLSEAASGNQIWGKRFDTSLDNLFEIEEELVLTIASTMGGKIEQQNKSISIKKPARDLKSYDYLARGWYHCERFTPQDAFTAIEQGQKCLEIDPTNVDAHTLVSATNNVLLYENWTRDRSKTRQLSIQHISRALELDPDHAMTHAFMAERYLFEKDFEKSMFHANKAIELSPALPDGYSYRGYLLAVSGEIDEAIRVAELSMQLDPYHYYMGWNAGQVYRIAGRYQDAIDAFRSVSILPASLLAEIAACQFALGRTDEARATMNEYHRLAREQMPNYPHRVDDWRALWDENVAYVLTQGFDKFFDLLLRAGLCDQVENGNDSILSLLVLPFENLGGDPDQEYFSDGITESLILKLGSFSGIEVKSRHASFAYKNSPQSIDEIASELNLTYIVEGSVRRLDERIRITVGLVDVASGNQLWGKRYDADLTDLFSLEEELSQSIAGTVMLRVDKEARLVSMRKPASDLKSYDYFMRGCYHLELFTGDNINIAIEQLKRCVALDPDNALAHARLGVAYMMALYENCTANRADAQEQMDRHFARALELDPDDAEAHAFMAERLLYIKDFDRALIHARKAVDLNPAMADGYSMLAWHAGATRQIELALEYCRKSMQIDIHHPYAGWNAGEIYRLSGDYEKAIETFRSMAHMSNSVRAQVAACLSGLGRIEEARAEMRRYLDEARQQMHAVPASRRAWYELWCETMPYKFQEDSDDLFALLEKAGLCDDLEEQADSTASIAVLPFENMSGDPEQDYFSDGITSDIIATLSKFSHLRTVSRYSTLRYKYHRPSIAEIAEQQNVGYLLEGNVRKSGEQIRVSAELIDTRDESICWSERYDRDLDDLFAVQDEITRHIALAMKVRLDDGDMALHRSKGATNIKAWELTLAAVDLQDTYIRKNILESRAMAQEATRLDPDYAYAWITLGWTYWQEAYSGWSDSIEDLIDGAVEANRHALGLDPNYGEVWSQAGMNHQMKHEFEEAIEACLKGVELEPGSAEAHALTAYAYVVSGACDEARKYEQNMRKLCPILPNWYYLVSGGIEKKSGNLDLAIDYFQQGLEVEPDSPLCRFYLIDALMEKGDTARARRLADEIRALDSSVTGKGIVHANSSDPDERRRFHDNLARFDLV